MMRRLSQDTSVATLLITCVALLNISVATSAWEEDVHYILTFWIANQAGLSRQDADAVARANQGLDDSDHNAAIPTVLWIILRGDEGAARDLQLKHFPTDASLPSPALRRVVAPNSSAARRRMEQVVMTPLASMTLQELGESLHPLQDSWSHQGVPDIPFNLRPNLISAHPKARGGWRSHDADTTNLHIDEVVQVARASYDAVARLLSNNVGLRDHPATPWAKLEPVVRSFAAAATSEAKAEWARRWIPESERASATDAGLGRSRTNVTVLTSPSDVTAQSQPDSSLQPDRGLMSAARAFLVSWLTEHDVRSAMNEIDLPQVSKQLETSADSAGNLSSTAAWCQKVLTLLLVADHDVINRYGHGDPDATGYDEIPLTPTLNGLFRARPALSAPALLVTDFVRSDVGGDPALALVLAIPGSRSDTVTLVWRRITGQWKIVALFPLAH
jgi:hypothetical protein